MSVKDLPQEIWIQIFYLLDKRDVYIAMFTCKSWYYAALPSYFQNIQYHQEVNIPEQLFKYGYLIKSLTLHSNRRKWGALEKSEFLKTLYYAPNLKKLDFSTCYYSYKKRLDFLFQLSEPYNYLYSIEEIVFGKYWGVETNYFFVCYNARKSIKRMELFVSGEGVTGAPDKRLLDYLPQFTSLTHLNIEYEKDSNLTMLDILQCCDNIIEFVYVNRLPASSQSYNQNSTKTNKHLKRLTITAVENSIYYINYISNMAEQLDYLELDFEGSIEYNIFSLIEKFSNRLKNIKHLNIIAPADYRPDIRIMQTKAFYSTLLNVRDDSNVRYNATIIPVGFKDQITISGGKANFTYATTIDLCSSFEDIQGIVKSLNFSENNRFSLLYILSCAKNYPNHESLYARFGPVLNFMATKTAISISSNRPSQTLLDSLYKSYPNAETISFDRKQKFKGRILGTTWDLTAFQQLKTFNFDANHICVQDHDFVFLKFDYGDYQCYKRICFVEDVKKNMPVTVKAISSLGKNVFIVTIKVTSQLVKIHCKANKFYTIESLS